MFLISWIGGVGHIKNMVRVSEVFSVETDHLVFSLTSYAILRLVTKFL